jgi:hypothetical protein
MIKGSYLEILQEVPSDEIINCLKKAYAKWASETYEIIDDNEQERFLGTDYQELSKMFIDDIIKGITGCNWSIEEEFEDFELNEECEDYLIEFVTDREFIYFIKNQMSEMINAA